MLVRGRLLWAASLSAREPHDCCIPIRSRASSASQVLVGIGVDRELEERREAARRRSGPHNQRTDPCAVWGSYQNIGVDDVSASIVLGDQRWKQWRKSSVGFLDLVVTNQLQGAREGDRSLAFLLVQILAQLSVHRILRRAQRTEQ